MTPAYTLLTTVFILSGVVNMLSSSQSPTPCEERLPETAGVGGWVDVHATCYPNGNVSYNWSSDLRTHRLQIEYQCYNNATTYQEMPNPPEPLVRWTDIKSDNRTLIVQPWDDAASCVFSGCYESGREMAYSKYWIPNSTCSTYRNSDLIKSSSPTIDMPSAFLSPVTHKDMTSDSEFIVPTIDMTSAFLSPLLHSPTVFPTVLQYSEHTATEWWIGVAVPIAVVALITVGIVGFLIFIMKKLRSGKFTRPIVRHDDRIDDSFSPVLLEQSRPISESRDTVVCQLKYHHLEYESSPRGYIRYFPETDGISLIDEPANSNILLPPDEHCESADVTNVNVVVGSQEEGGEVPAVTETVKDLSRAEEDEEKQRRKDIGRNDDEVNGDMYESLESKMPENEFPANELHPEEPTFSDNDPLSMSFYTYGGSVQANTSRTSTSGYISEPHAMWNRSPILLSKAEESKEAEV